jgi:hypothetical protein
MTAAAGPTPLLGTVKIIGRLLACLELRRSAALAMTGGRASPTDASGASGAYGDVAGAAALAAAAASLLSSRGVVGWDCCHSGAGFLKGGIILQQDAVVQNMPLQSQDVRKV